MSGGRTEIEVVYIPDTALDLSYGKAKNCGVVSGRNMICN